MNNRRHLLIVFLTLALSSLSLPARLSEGGAIQGRILDKKTKEPLESVVVEIVEIDKNTVSDRTGAFGFTDIPEGQYSITFVLAGFEDLIKKNIDIKPQKVTRLLVELEESIPPLHEEVTVTADPLPKVERNTASVVSLEREEASTMPGSFRDISRVLRVIPGTSQLTEKSNDLVVRGGSPWENGFFIDNIQIPNLNHFQLQGGAGGAFSILNLSLVKDIDIFTGGYSASFGNRMSSVIDISFREGARDKIHSQFFLHLTGFGLAVEGPLLRGKGSWLLSLNRSYHDLVLKMANYEGVIPRFGDLHFKLVYDINSQNRITLLNIFGDSRISYDLEKALEQGLNSYLDFITNQNTLGLNWFSSWSSKAYSNTSLSYSYFKNTYSATAIRPEAGTSDLKAVEEFNGELNIRNVTHYQFSQKHSLQFGFEVKPEVLDYDNYIAEYINGWGNPVPGFSQKGKVNTSKNGLFLTYLFKPLDPMTFSVGCRTDYFAFNKHFLFSPRLAVSWEIQKDLALKGAWGAYYQGLPLFLLMGNPENKDNKDPLAIHYILGLRWEINPSTSFNLDLYHKSYRNLPLTPEDPENFIADSGLDFGLFRTYSVLYDSGVAFSRGIEIFIQKKLTRGLSGLLSVSVFRSRFKDLNGVWRNRINDNRYLVTLVGGYEPDEKWTFHILWNWGGGKPYTPYDLELSREYNVGIHNHNEIFAKRYPDYMTLNLRVDRRFTFDKSSLNVFLGVTNLFNRKNLDRYFWNKLENRVDTIYQGPLLPELGVEFHF